VLPSLRPWIWRNLRVGVPADWEMLRYARDRKKGACTFADRYQYRLELSWREVPGPPDFVRMMRDYEARLRHEADGTDGNWKRVRHGPWHGLTGGGGNAGLLRHARYGRFVAPESCLVELVFFQPRKEEKGLTAAILDGVRAEPAVGGDRRWRAFGMEFLVPEEMDLRSCRAEPAAVRMRFGVGERDERNDAFERLGLLHYWMKGSVSDWLERRAGAAVKRASAGEIENRGHRVAFVTGRRRRRGGSLFGGRWLAVEQTAWICPADGRLYCGVHEFPAKEEKAAPPGRNMRLRCCASLEAAV